MLGVAVVGCGYWGPKIARNFNSLPGCELRVICDLDPARLEPIARDRPGVQCTCNFEDVLTNPSVDAVAICTPVSTHYALAKAALENGRHVLLEKPMTQSLTSAQELVDLAAAKRLVLQIDFPFVYCGAVQKIRTFIDNGNVGELLYYDSVRVNLGLFQSDVNVFWDLAPHDLSILFYLIDSPPLWVSAVGSTHYCDYENVGYITVMFDDMLIAYIHVNWLSPVKLRSTLIGGSKKLILYDDLAPSEKVKVFEKGVTMTDNPSLDNISAFVDYRIGDVHVPHIKQGEPLEQVCRSFIEAIDTGVPPLSDGHMGLKVVRILEAAQRSLSSEGQRVRL